MEPFTSHKGIVTPLEALNVDTDQIIPKQFLKRIERTGYGDVLFYDWRYNEDGSPNMDFEMNASRYQGASILLTKDNFGCGSSREHAPWALKDYGFRVLLATSFADIFNNNCFNNGILPIKLQSDTIEELFEEVREQEGYRLEVDLIDQKIKKPNGIVIHFDIDSNKKTNLLNGYDHISLTLLQEEKIADYEKHRGIAV